MFQPSSKRPSRLIHQSCFLWPASTLLLGALALALPQQGFAQASPAMVATDNLAQLDSGALPQAPMPDGEQAMPPAQAHVKSRLDKQVEPHETAPRLGVGGKILLGMRATVAPIAVAGWVATASVQQARESRPNYPNTIGGYGQRLGAGAARAASDTIITDSVLSPIFREDPRYYKLGVGHGVWERTRYAVSRVFVTRTDSGKPTPNFALLIGDVAGASLTQLYYPQVNRGVGDVAKTYGTSLLGAGIGFCVREFIGKWLYAIHLKPDYDGSV